MEHIVQIGINVDDEAIRKAIIKSVSDKVTKEIMENLGVKEDKYGIRDDSIHKMVDKLVNNKFEEIKDEVIDKSSAILADKMMRSKIVREKIGDNFIKEMGFENE